MCSAPKGHNSNQVNWISLFAQKATEETVRVSNNYRQKHLAKLVRVSNNYRQKEWHGFIFTRDIILRTAKAAFGSQVWCRIFVEHNSYGILSLPTVRNTGKVNSVS